MEQEKEGERLACRSRFDEQMGSQSLFAPHRARATTCARRERKVPAAPWATHAAKVVAVMEAVEKAVANLEFFLKAVGEKRCARFVAGTRR